jgi:hypothetical protein
MVLYAALILIVSLAVFGGIGFVVFSQLNNNTSEESENAALTDNASTDETDAADETATTDTPAPEPEGQISESFSADLVYENAFLPGTSIAYSEDWSYTNETEASEYANLIKRTITLTKGTSELTISFQPKFVGGCTGENSDLSLRKNLTESGLSRYDLTSNPGQYYYTATTGNQTESSDCLSFLTPIVTTIASSDAPDYAAQFPDEGTVQSLVTVSLVSDNIDHIAEADAMMNASTFGFVSQ